MSSSSSGGGESGSGSGGAGGGGVSQQQSTTAAGPSTSPNTSLSQRRSSAAKGKSDLRLSVGTHLKAAPGGRSGVSVHDAPHSPIDLPDKEVTEQPADEQQPQAREQPLDGDKGKQSLPAVSKPALSASASTPTSSTAAPSLPSTAAAAPASHALLALQMMQGQVPPISSGFPSFAYANPQAAPSAPASSPSHAPLQPPPGLPSPHSVPLPALSTAFLPVTPSSSAQFLASGLSTPSSVSSTSSSSSSTSPPSPPPSDGRSIALRYLPTGMQLDGLHALCSQYGAITAIRLKRDQNTGMALGYGFVHYENKEDAERAAEALDGRALGNKLIRVQIAKSPRGAAAGGQWSASAAATGARGAVVLSGVPRIWTSAQLQTVGSVYGQVTEVALLDDGKLSTDLSSRSAVLRFAEPTSAVACVAALNGTIPAGASEPLSVRLSSSPDRSGHAGSFSGGPPSALGSAQRSRRSSAHLSGPPSSEQHPSANQPAAFFTSSFDPAAAHAAAAAAGHQSATCSRYRVGTLSSPPPSPLTSCKHCPTPSSPPLSRSQPHNRTPQPALPPPHPSPLTPITLILHTCRTLRRPTASQWACREAPHRSRPAPPHPPHPRHPHSCTATTTPTCIRPTPTPSCSSTYWQHSSSTSSNSNSSTSSSTEQPCSSPTSTTNTRPPWQQLDATNSYITAAASRRHAHTAPTQPATDPTHPLPTATPGPPTRPSRPSPSPPAAPSTLHPPTAASPLLHSHATTRPRSCASYRPASSTRRRWAYRAAWHLSVRVSSATGAVGPGAVGTCSYRSVRC